MSLHLHKQSGSGQINAMLTMALNRAKIIFKLSKRMVYFFQYLTAPEEMHVA